MRHGESMRLHTETYCWRLAATIVARDQQMHERLPQGMQPRPAERSLQEQGQDTCNVCMAEESRSCMLCGFAVLCTACQIAC